MPLLRQKAQAKRIIRHQYGRFKRHYIDRVAATSDTSYSLSQRSGHDSRKTLRRSQSAAEPRAEASKGGFFSRVKDWVFTSEPSTHALKQRRKEAFQKAGLLLDDPKAAAKLHAPLGGNTGERHQTGGQRPLFREAGEESG